jgi:hypothetical protein
MIACGPRLFIVAAGVLAPARVAFGDPSANRIPSSLRETRSERFQVLSDAPPRRVEELLKLAEDTFDAVGQFAARLELPTSVEHEAPGSGRVRLAVLYFNDWKDFDAFARGAGFAVNPLVPGYFDEASNRSVVFNFENAEFIVRKRRELAEIRAVASSTVADGKAAEGEPQKQAEAKLRLARAIERQIDQYLDLLSATVVRHEIAHQVLFRLGIQKPAHRDRRWLKEGLAMQFETAAPPNRHRLADFAAIDWKRSPLFATALIQDPTLLGPGGADAPQAYAAAYALVLYLMDRRPTQFAAYLRSIQVAPSTPDEEREAFEAAFGKLTPEFEAHWREYAAGRLK